MNQKLLIYIKKSLGMGKTPQEVKKSLLEAGWQENEIDDAMHFIQKQDPAKQINAYNTKHFGWIGFFFTLLPVFIMSNYNSKVLPNGDKTKKGLKKYFILFISFFLFAIIADFILSFYAAYKMNLWLSENPDALFSLLTLGGKSLFKNSSLIILQDISRYISYFFVIINIILLIFTTRFINKTEYKDFKNLNEQQLIKTKPFILPLLVGLLFVVSIFFISSLERRAAIYLVKFFPSTDSAIKNTQGGDKVKKELYDELKQQNSLPSIEGEIIEDPYGTGSGEYNNRTYGFRLSYNAAEYTINESAARGGAKGENGHLVSFEPRKDINKCNKVSIFFSRAGLELEKKDLEASINGDVQSIIVNGIIAEKKEGEITGNATPCGNLLTKIILEHNKIVYIFSTVYSQNTREINLNSLNQVLEKISFN